MCKTEAYEVYKQSLFCNIREQSVEEALRLCPVFYRSYEKGQCIVSQGENVRSIGCIIEGQLVCTKYHYDGSSQVLQVLDIGDFIGLEAISSSFHTSPYMVVASSVCILSIFPYADFLTSSYIDDRMKVTVLKNVLNIVADDNIRKLYKIDVLSKRTLRERILTYLSVICEKRQGNTINLGMTQEQFANYLCVNRSVLSKELNQMRREGIIDFRGKIYTLIQ